MRGKARQPQTWFLLEFLEGSARVSVGASFSSGQHAGMSRIVLWASGLEPKKIIIRTFSALFAKVYRDIDSRIS